MGQFKMIECYYIWCPKHSKDEPFCSQVTCNTTDEQMELYSEMRKNQLKEQEKENAKIR